MIATNRKWFSKWKFSKRTILGYYQTKCYICGKKALYHLVGKGYCSKHKNLATQDPWYTRYTGQKETKAAYFKGNHKCQSYSKKLS